MKPTPIHIVIARIQRLSLAAQIFHLRALVKLEPLYSIRRSELESLLQGRMLKQLKRESRAA